MSAPEQLAESRYVTLILRVLVDRDGKLMQGEVGGRDPGQSTERWLRFHGSADLLRAVQAWLAGTPDATPHNL